MEISRNKQISVVVGAFLLMLASAIVSNSTGYFIVSVTESLEVTRAQFSVYYTIVQLTTAVVSLTIGSMYSKFSMRQIFLAGSVGTFAGFLVMSRLNSLAMVYIGALVIGFFQALIIVPVVKVVNAWVPGKNNGTAIGIVMAATGVGGLMMGQVMPRVVAYVDWRTGYVVCAVMFLAFTLVGLVLAGGKSPVEEKAVSEADVKKKNAEYVSRALKTPAFYVILICCFLLCLSHSANQHLAAQLEAKDMNVDLVAAIMSVWSIGLTIAKVLEGVFYGRVKEFIYVAAIVVSGCIGFVALTSGNPAMLTLGVIFLGIGCAGDTVLVPGVVNDIFGKEMSSAVWGFCWAAFQFGNAAGVVLQGALFDATGSYDTGYRFAGIVCVVIAVIFAAFLVKSSRQKAAEAGKGEATQTA